MFDAFVFLFEHFQNLGHLPSKHYISRKLNEAGFDYDEIVNVLKCFDELFNEDGQYEKFHCADITSKTRVFSAEEIAVIPEDIRGYIFFLYQQEVMDFYEIEMLIHTIMQINSCELDLETVKVITLITAWAKQTEIPVLIGDDLLNTLYEKKIVH